MAPGQSRDAFCVEYQMEALLGNAGFDNPSNFTIFIGTQRNLLASIRERG